MPITLQPSVYRAFGISQSWLTNSVGKKFTRRDFALLLAASFLINVHLHDKRTFGRRSGALLVELLERAIAADQAFNERIGSLKSASIDELASRLKRVVLLRSLFGAEWVGQSKSIIEDAYHAHLLAYKMMKTPLKSLEALNEFNFNIETGETVLLDGENLNYLVAMGDRRSYSYAYDGRARRLYIADRSITPFDIVGNRANIKGWYGGVLFVELRRIMVNGLSGRLNGNADKVVRYGNKSLRRTKLYSFQKVELVNVYDFIRARADGLKSSGDYQYIFVEKDEGIVNSRIARRVWQYIIDELLKNAFDFCGGKPVEISLKRAGGRMIFSIKNYQPVDYEAIRSHGVMGVDRDKVSEMSDVDLLFDLHITQGWRGRTFGGGGAGLHNVKKLIELYGGRIDIYTDSNTTVVTVTLDINR